MENVRVKLDEFRRYVQRYAGKDEDAESWSERGVDPKEDMRRLAMERKDEMGGFVEKHRCSERTIDVFYGLQQSPMNVQSPFKTMMRCIWSKPGEEPTGPIENYVPDDRWNRLDLSGESDGLKVPKSLPMTDRSVPSSENK